MEFAIEQCMQLGYTRYQLIEASKHKLAPNQFSTGEDKAYNDAIVASYQSSKGIVNDYSSPLERKRKNQVPVGLKNTGNTCYFNSLLQTYFMNHQFVSQILDFKKPLDEGLKGLSAYKRIRESIKLVSNLQKLFGQMIMSDKKYADASLVLQSVVDEYGKFIPIGDQKDIGEFNIQFLTRIEEGLQSQDKYLEQTKENLTEEEMKVANSSDNAVRRSMTVKKLSGKQVLGQLFFGKQMQVLSFPTEEKIEEKRSEELFSTIYLDVNLKDLYNSWEESYFQQIEYKTPSGKVVFGQKSNYLLEVPGMLFFQLSRVKFDKEFQTLVKLNDRFVFDKEIYIDRFLFKNREQLKKTRESVGMLRREAESYENALRELREFQRSGISLLDIMGQCEEFLKLQNQGVKEKKKVNEVCEPVFFGVAKSSDMATTLKQITGLKKQIEDRMNRLQSKLNDLNKKIENSFDKYKQQKYKLVGLLIHEGSADSGHYYSYIFDHGQQLWRKYNDSNVTIESEENVFRMAFGGAGYASAYYLIYFSEQQLKTPNLAQFQLDLPILKSQLGDEIAKQFVNMKDSGLMRGYTITENRMLDYYIRLLMERVQVFQEVLLDNQQFQSEVEVYQQQNAAIEILDNYSEKFIYVNEVGRSIGGRVQKYELVFQKVPVLINFAIFLKKHKQNVNDKLQELIKWHLLDSSLRDYKSDLTLKDVIDLPKNKTLLQNLRKAMDNLYESKKPNLQVKNLELYQNLGQEYLQNVATGETICYCLEKAFEQKWQIVLAGIGSIFKDICNQSFSSIVQRVYEICLLNLCYLMEQEAQKKNIENFRKYFELLIAYSVSLKLEKNSHFHIQLIKWTQFILTKYLSNLEYKIKTEIDNLMDANLMELTFNDQLNVYLKIKDEELNLRIQQVYEQDIYSISIAKKEDLLIEKIRLLYNKFIESFKWQNQMFEAIITQKKFFEENDRKAIMGIK